MVERRTWVGAIRSAADVRTILDSTNRRGLERATTTALAEVVRPADDAELTPDASKVLPVDPRLAGLLYLDNPAQDPQMYKVAVEVAVKLSRL